VIARTISVLYRRETALASPESRGRALRQSLGQKGGGGRICALEYIRDEVENITYAEKEPSDD